MHSVDFEAQREVDRPSRRPGARRRFLVTDGQARAALAVTRMLGRAGHAVFVTSPRPRSLAGASRYSQGELAQAPIERGPEELRRSLLDADWRVGPDYVIGVTDPSLTVLHEASERFGSRLPPPESRAYFDASDKVRLFEVCGTLGIRVPRGVVVPGGRLPDESTLSGFGRSFVVRPARSWRIRGGQWVHGVVFVARSRDELAERVRNDPALSFPYLVQEHVSGAGCGLFVSAAEGKILSVFAHRRLREKPPWGGVSTLCESVAPSPDLVEAATRYVETARWSGLAMFEFKRCDVGGTAFLLEINARPWGSMALSRAAGVDFVSDLVSLARGRAPRPGGAYREGVRLRWWWGDVDHFYLEQTAKGRGRVPAAIVALGRAIAAGPRAETWDTFERDDPLPFGIETWNWLGR